jgi:hypothetical protein
MGISKIFKDKPKDEDGPIPQKEAKMKKDKKSKKVKGEVVPAAVSHAHAEPDDDDRVLAGLSPAAKLARQHTLRSKAEQEKRASMVSANSSEGTAGRVTGEPTWDNNTTTRQASTLPSIASVTGAAANSDFEAGRGFTAGNGGGPEVLHVTPKTTVVHAVAVSEQEYDSEDDSSEGETVDDVTYGLERTRLSEDAEFQATWGTAYIDRYAVPKKGILKRE